MKIKNNFYNFYKTNFFHKLKKIFYLFKANTGNNIYIGKKVKFLRYTKNLYIGSNVIFKDYSQICIAEKSGKISIGDNTTIGYYTFIYAKKKIIIGDNCLIAPFVYIIDHDHDIYNKNQINKSGLICKDIIIEPNVWIGTKAIILKGSIIRSGAVIGAGSVVKGEIPNNAIFAGNPGKIISYRK